ncbi:hypothetical protein O181_084598 [Austropuccinia psidii MF-1]|uniref:EKC/KEOPS complex subunit BUD32 n=1 Tax=Austropuccinia psidii MF-1 TaxID=1389203 RepID=A0A9Q3IKT2_9BASI|nr:hypothetical protein [Austropuccinia psidii MF-1]
MAIDFEGTLDPSSLVKQGAEARIYKLPLINGADGLDATVLLKYRFPKTYRHPQLDASLTKNRLIFEARSLTRASKAGVRVPGLKALDLQQGWLMLEWIDGLTLREWLDIHQHQPQSKSKDQLDRILTQVGAQLAKLHMADIVHGDLTTSNMMLREIKSDQTFKQFEVVLIDFGLSAANSLVEDKAVDLYVLERAFLSTHSDPSSQNLTRSSPLFEAVLEAYTKHLPKADSQSIINRLASVRLRGRKRTMIG